MILKKVLQAYLINCALLPSPFAAELKAWPASY